jgi:hypothetical protein
MKLISYLSLYSLLIVGYSGIVADLSAQGDPEYVAFLSGWSADELAAANTGAGADYLDDTARRVIQLINLARMDGAKFLSIFDKELTDHVAPRDQEYLSSLRLDLLHLRPLHPLKPHPALTQSAAAHAEDLGKVGMIGHNSSDGTVFTDRIKNYLKDAITTGENCDYGNDDPFEIVFDLLIDTGVPSHGHRKNILDDDYTHVGVATRPHIKFGFNHVMDFAGLVK